MYTIYHIPGVKVGCTKQNPKVRVRQQGYTQFEVLEVHEDVVIANRREIELQLELFGVRDNKNYISTINAGKISQLPENNQKRMKPKSNKDNYFKPKSKEHAENIRKARIGIPHTPERKEAIRQAKLKYYAKKRYI